MASKLIVLACLVAACHASVAPAALVAGPAVVSARLEEFDPAPQYQFGYEVADANTGDYKSQSEQRNGDVVLGQYSLVEPDGTRRVVDYAADPINGFNAVVRKEPLVAAAPAVFAEPARYVAEPVVAARYAATPAVVPARYTAAPGIVPARYAAAPAVYAPAAAPAKLVAPASYAAYTAPVAEVAAPAYSPFARFTSPFAYNYAAAAPIVAV